MPDRPSPLRALPRGVIALGLVSLLMDTSSELVHGLLPAYLVGTLGASLATLGLIEGVAEATAACVKVFSGAWSDRLRRRKPLVVAGYGLAALAKPVFPLAASVGWVAGARFADRVGKGLRGAPRDALVAELVEPARRGAAYGLRQALDSVGAFLGPLLALAALALLAGDLRAALWVAVVPAALAVIVLLACVREPPRAPGAAPAVARRWRDAARLPARFWRLVALGVVFTLARFSEAFVVLRAQQAGLATALLPLVLVAMNVVYAAAAFPAGAAADRVPPRRLLLAGLGALVAADLVLAAADSPGVALAGAGLWGLHLALTQGLLSKLVADAAPAELRGTAFGVFHLATGLALLLASVLAGALWEALGAQATFLAGAGFAGLAAAGVVAGRRR